MSTNSESQDKKLQLDIHFLFKEFNKAYRIEVGKKDNWESDLNNELSRIAKKHNIDNAEYVKNLFKEYVEECQISDFEKAYLIKLNKGNNWKTRLKYELLSIANQYENSSLEEIEKIFHKYYYDNNPDKDLRFQELGYRISFHSQKIWTVIFLIITFFGGVIPIYSFIAGTLESNNIAQEKNEIEQEKRIKEYFQVLNKYAGKSYGLGRSEALKFLNTEEKCDNSGSSNDVNKNSNNNNSGSSNDVNKNSNNNNSGSSNDVNEDSNKNNTVPFFDIFNPFRSQKSCFKRPKHRLDGVNLENAALIGINLDDGFLNYANFKNAKLNNSFFKNAELQWSNFQGASMERSKFNGANLFKADFNCNDKKYDCINQGLTRLIGADFSSEDEEDENDKTNLKYAELKHALLENANFKNAILVGVDFEWADLRGADLSEADLSKAELVYTNLEGAQNITKEQIINANNWDSAIYDDKFRKNDLCNEKKKVKFKALIALKKDSEIDDYINQKDLSCFSFDQSSNLKGKDLTDVDFSNSNLTKADLRGATLTNVTWTETDLYCTDFRNTKLTSEQLKTINIKLDKEQKIKNIPVAIFDDNIDPKCQQYINERDNTTSN